MMCSNHIICGVCVSIEVDVVGVVCVSVDVVAVGVD